MSYLILGIVLLIIGLIIFFGSANMTYQANLEVQKYLPDTLEYLQAVQSSEYPIGIGLMVFGGAIMIAGAFSIRKYRNSNNNS